MANRIFIVTGAAGFLGGTVCRSLIKSGEKVRAFVLPNDNAIKFVPSEAEIIEGDLLDKQSLEKLFDVPEETDIVVLHIASMVYLDPDHNEKVMAVNVGGTKNIIEECQKHPNFKKLVYCGSTGSIPEQPKGSVIKEVDAYDPEKVIGCYSKSKAMAAQAVLDAVKNGLNACIVHPTGIMGPGDCSISETTKTVIRIIQGEMPVGINGSFNMADVRDLADGLIAAAYRGRKGESYILGNEEVSFKEFAKILYEEGNSPKIKFFLPIWLANFMAFQMEKKAAKKGEQPLMTRFSVYNLSRNNSFDYSKAKQELGYSVRSYKETLRDEIEWLKNTGKI